MPSPASQFATPEEPEDTQHFTVHLTSGAYTPPLPEINFSGTDYLTGKFSLPNTEHTRSKSSRAGIHITGHAPEALVELLPQHSPARAVLKHAAQGKPTHLKPKHVRLKPKHVRRYSTTAFAHFLAAAIKLSDAGLGTLNKAGELELQTGQTISFKQGRHAIPIPEPETEAETAFETPKNIQSFPEGGKEPQPQTEPSELHIA